MVPSLGKTGGAYCLQLKIRHDELKGMGEGEPMKEEKACREK